VQRVDDILSESLELNALKYVDRPINNALIDIIKQEGNDLIASLIQRGALLQGSQLKYDPAKNSSAELASGHITFTRIYMVPVPGERITLESYLDVNLYSFVNQQAATAS
jgi:phage tail sheath protein FI